MPLEPTPELKKEVIKKLRNFQNWEPMLASHRLFLSLLGNPTSITMLASVRQNPNQMNSLSELYESL